MKYYWLKFSLMCLMILLWMIFCTFLDCKISIEYCFHHYGDFSWFWRFLFFILFLFSPLFIGGSFNNFYEKKCGEGFKRNHTYLYIVLMIIFFMLIIVHLKIGNKYMSVIKEDALKNSYYSFGYVYGMHRDIKGMPYSVWTGLNENYTMRNSNVGSKIFNQINPGDTILVQVSFKYPVMHKVIKWLPQPSDYELYLKPDNRLIVKDVSTLDGDSLCNKFGVYLVYKAIPDSSLSNDSIVSLAFNDIYLRQNIVRYKVPQNYDTDTFLVYQNINNQIDNRLIVCAPEVNTPENRAKISDYGYIFHYDVYSKQEIESQCPRIKDYVEQYKKRITPPTN